YYNEIGNPHKNLVPEDRCVREQTLTNAQRLVTREVKEKEAMIVGAAEISVDLEDERITEMREKLKNDITPIHELAEVVSQLDCLQSFSQVSEENNYCRPNFIQKNTTIQNGRHPVIENVMEQENYVPNDIVLDEDAFILLITGPN